MLAQFSRILRRRRKSSVIRLDPVGRSQGCAVISYLTWPFVEGWQSSKARGHTNAFEVVAIADAFREQGLRVEVCDWDDVDYVPPVDCRVAMDIHGNLERWRLPQSCIKILHGTGPHWLHWNHAELTRLSAVRDRKGVAIVPRRQVAPSRGVEVADVVTILGNDYTAETFRFGGKPVIRIPISSAYDFPDLPKRNIGEAKRRFLWVGSYGMVHKGLDLALDAFSGMPDVELTVCGRPEKEGDFLRLYHRELRETLNIRLHGWIDMESSDFMELARRHAAVIYPSSAEGGAGSVIHCMHAGMVPLCTTAASIDLGGFGVHVSQGSVAAVREACRKFAALSDADVIGRIEATHEYVRKAHTRERFVENYRAFVKKLMAGEF